MAAEQRDIEGRMRAAGGRRRPGAVAAALVLLLVLPAAGGAQERPDDAACAPGTPQAPFTDRDAIPEAHRLNVDCAYDAGITEGFADGSYRPTLAVRRDHMASFIARTLDAADVPLDSGGEPFTDLDGNPHADAIHRLAAAEIVLGTTPTTFSPSALVRRDQIASFVLRAVAFARGGSLADLQVEEDRFTDVPPGNVHRPNINGAADLGLAQGRTATTYDPGGQARRDQMGTFLVRALVLLTDDDPDPGPSPSPSPSPSPDPGPGAFTLELVGHHDLAAPGHDGEVRPRGSNGDVALIGTAAFVAAGATTRATRSGPGRICTDHGGVKVVDLTDPDEPALLGTVDVEDTEGVLAGPDDNPRRGLQLDNVAVSVATVDALRHPQTGRHILAVATQRCEPPLDTGARVEFWDVTDPAAPTRVGVHDAGAGVVSDVRMFGREEGHGSGAYALVTVPGSAADGGAGDVRMLDIADVTTPEPVTVFPSAPAGAGADLGCRPAAAGTAAVQTPDRQRAIVSWYDGVAAGSASAAVLDVDLASPPEPTGDPDTPFAPMPRTWGYAVGSEGNAAGVEPFTGTDGRLYVLVSEDDLDPAATILSLAGTDHDACALPFGPRVHDEPGGSLAGEVAQVGRGCPASPLAGSDRDEADPYLTDPDGRIAFVAAGGDAQDGCGDVAKIARAEAAGALAVVLETGHDGLATPELGPDGGRPGIPVVAVATPTFGAMPDGATVTLEETQGTAGALHVVDFLADPPTVVATYRSPGARAWPPPDGIHAPHQARVLNDLAFTTWHSDGLRVLDLTDPSAPEEIGAYVPPDTADPAPLAGAGPTDRPGGGDLLRGGGWPDRALATGVAVQATSNTQGLVVVSDVHGGLYVLRYEDTRS